ncbi:serine/threonine-protein kinase [Streptomyces sp. NBC_00102]|uniref:serine/threonine-protein kinase n=1 Tax=Streptomyces sp. NBC_00102 TaxID=2975652 RepID=UPI002253B93E|nr:serine/threonine-protein kinase [Streptomyces sp. NBC_00102]MCX5398593.1 serine/threonine protein kinase [Streptomyces sp. NBC_00102]
MDPLTPQDPPHVGPFRLLGRLGTGGMGRVYLARSESGRTVAVKVVHAQFAVVDEFRIRFAREVAALERVGDAGTAPVIAADTEAALPWVAIAYVPGPSLRTVVGDRRPRRDKPTRDQYVEDEWGRDGDARDGGRRLSGAERSATEAASEALPEARPLPVASVRFLAAGLGRALIHIHAAGLVHRDLKPSNILLTVDGPRIIDFGVARAVETVTDGGLTSTGAVIGSPGFMSPEQVRGEKVTAASDIFCVGAVLAYAATGVQPFGASDSGVHAIMFRIANNEPDLTALPAELGPLVRSCLDRDPDRRPTAEALARSAPARRDGRPEAWLPPELLAVLGSQAARLLDTDTPAPESVTPAPTPPAGRATPTATDPTADPTADPSTSTSANPATPPATAPATRPAAHPATTTHVPVGGHPRRRSALVAACAVTGLLGAGLALQHYTAGGLAGLGRFGGPGESADLAKDPDTPHTDTGTGTGTGNYGDDSSGNGPRPRGSTGPGDIPEVYLGAWEGVLRGSGGSPFETGRIEIEQGTRGHRTATYIQVFGERLCMGRSVLVGAYPDHLVLDESDVTTGIPAGRCAPVGRQTLTVRSPDVMEWTSGAVHTTFRRAASGPRAVPATFLGRWKRAPEPGPRQRRLYQYDLTVTQGPVGAPLIRYVSRSPKLDFDTGLPAPDPVDCASTAVVAGVGDLLIAGPDTLAPVDRSDPDCFSDGSRYLRVDTYRGRERLLVHGMSADGESGEPGEYYRAAF